MKPALHTVALGMTLTIAVLVKLLNFFGCFWEVKSKKTKKKRRQCDQNFAIWSNLELVQFLFIGHLRTWLNLLLPSSYARIVVWKEQVFPRALGRLATIPYQVDLVYLTTVILKAQVRPVRLRVAKQDTLMHPTAINSSSLVWARVFFKEQPQAAKQFYVQIWNSTIDFFTIAKGRGMGKLVESVVLLVIIYQAGVLNFFALLMVLIQEQYPTVLEILVQIR